MDPFTQGSLVKVCGPSTNKPRTFSAQYFFVFFAVNCQGSNVLLILWQMSIVIVFFNDIISHYFPESRQLDSSFGRDPVRSGHPDLLRLWDGGLLRGGPHVSVSSLGSRRKCHPRYYLCHPANFHHLCLSQIKLEDLRRNRSVSVKKILEKIYQTRALKTQRNSAM